MKIGNREMSRALNRYGDSVIRDVKRIIVETAQIILSNAKALAPVDDGNLRDSIEMEVLMGGLKAKVQVTAHYAIYVEFGTGIYAAEGDGRQTPWTYWSPKLNRFVTTRGMPPQPYWEPAIDAGQRYFDTEMGRLG